MVIFIHGADTYRSRRYLNEQIERFKATRDADGYNVVRVDVGSEPSARIFEELYASPFLGEKRMVILINPLASSDKGLLGELAQIISNKKIPDSTVAVFWQGLSLSAVKEAKALQALLLKEKYAHEFKALAGAQLEAWLAAQAKDLGATISPAGIRGLAGVVGADTGWGRVLLEQLASYALNREITERDVELFAGTKIDQSIFALMEAAMAGNHRQAFTLLAAARAAGQDDGYILAMLTREVRLLMQVHDFMGQAIGATTDAAARELKIHPFVAKKTWAQARRFSWPALICLHNRLVQVERSFKTGTAPLPALIETFIGKM